MLGRLIEVKMRNERVAKDEDELKESYACSIRCIGRRV